MPLKLSIIGSGNWGSVVANISSRNIQKMANFDKTVKMWVFEEMIEGKKLTEIINTQHQNVKYLPGVDFPENLVADSDIVSCAKDADFLVFITPHQFLDRICSQIVKHIKKDAIAVSFIKGIFCSSEKIELISEHIRSRLHIPVCVVSGANVANEIAAGKFAEATLGFNEKEASLEKVKIMQQLFSVPTLRITPVNEIAGVEIPGALKNAVALAAGFIDGLKYGSNTKAAVLRIGMIEIQNFCNEFFHVNNNSIFWQSSGFADLITTCYAGRNRKCAEAFAVNPEEDWDAIERRMLGGQKLQGPSTCKEVYEFLKGRGRLDGYPLLRQIYRISFGEDGKPEKPETIVSCLVGQTMPEVVYTNKSKC